LINTDHQIQVFLAKNVLADAITKTDPWGFHDSFSKPLWMDCAMDDSIRST